METFTGESMRRAWGWWWACGAVMLTGCWDVNVLLRNTSPEAVSMQAIVGDASPPPVAGDAVAANTGSRGELLTVSDGDLIKFAVINGDFTRIETAPIVAPLDDLDVAWDGTNLTVTFIKGTPDKGQVLVENTTGAAVDIFPTLQPGPATGVDPAGYRMDAPNPDPDKLNAVQYEVKVGGITQQIVTIRSLSSSGYRVVWNGATLAVQPVATNLPTTRGMVSRLVTRAPRR